MTVPMTLPVWAEAADTKEEASDTQDLEDGVYIVDFNADSSMFHTNEACEGKGQLTVKDGKMTLHISLVSKNIVKNHIWIASPFNKNSDFPIDVCFLTDKRHGPILESAYIVIIP